MRFVYHPSIDRHDLECADLIDKDNGNITVACDVELEYQNLLMGVPSMLNMLEAFVRVEDVAESGKPLMSNQGQAMDGYSMLANFRDCVKTARKVIDLAKRREGGA